MKRKETFTVGMNFVKDGRADIIARGIQKCMEYLELPVKVSGRVGIFEDSDLPEGDRLIIDFEMEDNLKS